MACSCVDVRCGDASALTSDDRGVGGLMTGQDWMRAAAATAAEPQSTAIPRLVDSRGIVLVKLPGPGKSWVPIY